MDEASARVLAAGEIAATQAEANRVAEDKRLHGLPVDHVPEYVITGAERISSTWCFSYQNRLYIETGEIRYALGGNGPILVGDDGRIGRAGSALPTDQYVAEFERPTLP